MPLNMKVFSCTDSHLLDCNDQYLPAGKYYFKIKNFTDKNTVLCNVTDKDGENKLIQYEFRYFTLMTMMAKGQSYLARRANIMDDNMPNFPSPKKIKTPEFLKKKKALNKYIVELKKHECSICLENNFENSDPLRKLGCDHIFHKHCIKDWMKLNKTCPLCRKEVKKVEKVSLVI
jgi:hypothetical protein